MDFLFADDRRPAGKRPPFRKTAARPKAVAAELPPLPEGWVLAHCDGGARGNPGPAGFGAVLVSSTGEPLAELSEFLGFRTNNFAEYSGLLAVLAWALEHGQPQVRVISDSELMVKQVQGKYKVNSPDLKPLHEEARRRIGQLKGFEIFHALRHKNKVADQLANEAMDRGMGKPVAGAGADAAAPRAVAVFAPRAGAVSVPRQMAAAAAREAPPRPAEPAPGMLRGFVRDGVVHLLGGKALPEGSFVKILPE